MPKRKRVHFRATKHISKPIKVKFYTRSGKEVSFKATRKIRAPIEVEFYTRQKTRRTRIKK